MDDAAGADDCDAEFLDDGWRRAGAEALEASLNVRIGAGGAMTRGRSHQSVFVIAGFPRSLVNFRGSLLNAMRELGHSVAAAAPGLNDDRSTLKQLQAMQIACHDIPLGRTGINPFADLRLLASLTAMLHSKRPDVVFAYTMKAVIFGLLASAIVRVPRRYALITGLGYAFTGEPKGRRRLVQNMAKALYRTSLRHANTIFFQNPDDEQLFRRHGLVPALTRTIIVNGSGIDLLQFRPAAFPAGPVRFLLAARLLTTKGITEFAAAAALVRNRHSRVEFHLLGAPDSNPDAIPIWKVKEWARDGILIWHGEVSDTRPHISACHVYVLPSYREGTPRSVLEAMAMGRAVITTDVPGCRETVVHGDNGFLVQPRSVEMLARAMERFIAEPCLIRSMGARSRALAKAKFDVREVNDRILRGMKLV